MRMIIFSKGLRPGSTPIKPYQITKRWKRNVKDCNKIKDPIDHYTIRVTEDFYSWKIYSLINLMSFRMRQKRQ